MLADLTACDYTCVSCGATSTLSPSGGAIPTCCDERHDMRAIFVFADGSREDRGLLTHLTGATKCP